MLQTGSLSAPNWPQFHSFKSYDILHRTWPALTDISYFARASKCDNWLSLVLLSQSGHTNDTTGSVYLLKRSTTRKHICHQNVLSMKTHLSLSETGLHSQTHWKSIKVKHHCISKAASSPLHVINRVLRHENWNLYKWRNLERISGAGGFISIQ